MLAKDLFFQIKSSIGQIERALQVDKLIFQDLSALVNDVLSFNKKLDGLEASCFDGNYVTGDIFV